MAPEQTGTNASGDEGRDVDLVRTPEGDVVPFHTQLEHNLASNIRQLREQRGLSQTGLAKKMNEAGLPWHQTTVSRVEALDRPVQTVEAYALATILDVSVDVLTSPPEYQRLVDDLAKAYDKLYEELNLVYEHAISAFEAQSRLDDVLDVVEAAGIKAYRTASEGAGEELTELAEWALTWLPEDAINDARQEYIRTTASTSAPRLKRRSGGPQHRRSRGWRRKQPGGLPATLEPAASARRGVTRVIEGVRAGATWLVDCNKASDFDQQQIVRLARVIGARTEISGSRLILFPPGTDDAKVQQTLNSLPPNEKATQPPTMKEETPKSD